MFKNVNSWLGFTCPNIAVCKVDASYIFSCSPELVVLDAFAFVGDKLARLGNRESPTMRGVWSNAAGLLPGAPSLPADNWSPNKLLWGDRKEDSLVFALGIMSSLQLQSASYEAIGKCEAVLDQAWQQNFSVSSEITHSGSLRYVPGTRAGQHPTWPSSFWAICPEWDPQWTRRAGIWLPWTAQPLHLFSPFRADLSPPPWFLLLINLVQIAAQTKTYQYLILWKQYLCCSEGSEPVSLHCKP